MLLSCVLNNLLIIITKQTCGFENFAKTYSHLFMLLRKRSLLSKWSTFISAQSRSSSICVSSRTLPFISVIWSVSSALLNLSPRLAKGGSASPTRSSRRDSGVCVCVLLSALLWWLRWVLRRGLCWDSQGSWVRGSGRISGSGWTLLSVPYSLGLKWPDSRWTWDRPPILFCFHRFD